MPTPPYAVLRTESFLNWSGRRICNLWFEGRLLHDKALTAKRMQSPTHDHCSHDVGAYQPEGCVARVSVYATGFVEGMKAMSKEELDSLRNRVSRAIAFQIKTSK